MKLLLTDLEKDILLKIAREAIICAVKNMPLPPINLKNHLGLLREEGASFVTLTKLGKLRGCIGALEAFQPLILDVQEHAVAAALEDYRFPNVKLQEIEQIKIEVSRLTPTRPVNYSSPDELIEKLRIGIDGVLIIASGRRATFLPQVWEKVPDPERFLSQLCMKMGAAPDLWRNNIIEVLTYQVEKFEEA